MSNQAQVRTYLRKDSAVFRKTSEAFGGLSNMAPGYPIRINGVLYHTSEALYQACRFPHRPEVQKLIVGQHSPMTAKMKSKPYRKDSRPDWDQVRVKVMRWCLQVKLAQNWEKFSRLLLSTGDRPIVEDSRKDDYWGAKEKDEKTLAGMNVLGRLLMELREFIKKGKELRLIEPPNIPNFFLFGEPVATMDCRQGGQPRVVTAPALQPQKSEVMPLFEYMASSPSECSPQRELVPSLGLKHSLISGLQPYGVYKDSGQDWLGLIPGHWRVSRIKTVIRERDTRSTDGQGLLLSLTRNRGLIARSDMTDKIHGARTLVGYKRYEPGEIVMNRMQAWSGMFGAGPKSGLVSPDYGVFEILGQDLVGFLLARIKAPDLVAQFALESKGIGSGFNRLYSDKLGAIAISLPPPDEQAIIVRFLDHVNHKIDRFIRAKRKMIALLNEQKQTIIHRAVTRGLNPDVRIKPSGIPWLGDIPEHWDIVRNMALFAHRVEAGIAGLPVLQVSLRSGITAEELDQFGRPKRLIADPTKYKLLRKADMAYNTMRMWQGAVGVSPTDGLVSPAYVVLIPRQDTCPEFYEFVFRTEVYKQQVNRQSTGIVSDRNRLYWDSFKQMPNISVPRPEQEAIVDFIRVATRTINIAITRTEREIGLMQEYRTRLTTDVVTGKLDVCEVAAKLPELEESTGTGADGEDMDEEPMLDNDTDAEENDA